MICGRVGNIIKRFARNSDDVRLANFKRARGLEWKLLRRPVEHNLSNFTPLRTNRNFGADSSGVVAVGIFKRNVNIAVCFHFCVNDAARKRVPFFLGWHPRFCVPVKSTFGPSPSRLGYVSAVDSDGQTIWIADAHRDGGRRFVVRADEKLTAFLELERATRESLGFQNAE
jgi:hypothetical protein